MKHMSRIIKFRVWDKKFRIMYGDGISVQGDGTFYLERADHDGNEIEIVESEHGELVLMQFTGLCDKNGKEIYEGDLSMQFGHLSKCIYEPFGGFMWERIKEQGGYYYCLMPKDDEVIGNIHENPELLEP